MKMDNKQFHEGHAMRPFTDALEADVWMAVRRFEQHTDWRVLRVVVERLPSGHPTGVVAKVRKQ